MTGGQGVRRRPRIQRRITSIRHLVPQDAAGLRRIERPKKREGGRIFDSAARVPRREFNVVEDGVQRVTGIEFAGETSRQSLVLPAGKRLAALHRHPNYMGIGIGATEKCQQAKRKTCTALNDGGR